MAKLPRRRPRPADQPPAGAAPTGTPPDSTLLVSPEEVAQAEAERKQDRPPSASPPKASRTQQPTAKARFGKYVIRGTLGKGGMGAVYLAEDEQLRRKVALKILPKDKAQNVTLARRFRAEGQAAARLNHPNIVKVHEAGEINGQAYLALEYIKGSDAHGLLVRKGRLSPEKSLAIVRQVAEALAHAESLGIVHRDIKPSNLMIDTDGRVKLADMGLARSIAETEEAGITRAGTTVGTVDFMPPEQARNSKSADVRSDIYSLGGTWYQLLTGQVPFPDGDLMQKLKAHATQPRPDVRALDDRIPEAMSAVVRRMMAVRPENRHQTAAELIADLEALKKGTAAVVDAIFDDLPLAEEDTGASLEEEHTGLIDAGEEGTKNPAGKGLKKKGSRRPKKDRLPPRKQRAESVAGSRVDADSVRKLTVGLVIAAAVVGVGFLLKGLSSGFGDGSETIAPQFPRQDEIGRALPEEADREEAVQEGAAPPRPVAAVAPSPPKVEADPAALPEWAQPREAATPKSTIRVESSPFIAADSRRSLLEAIDSLPEGGGTIELADAGPHTLAASATTGSLVITAPPGQRATVHAVLSDDAGRGVLAVSRGDLTLRNVDLVVRDRRTTRGERPAVLSVEGGRAQLIDTTINAAGAEVIGVRLSDGDQGATRPPGTGQLLLRTAALFGPGMQPVVADGDRIEAVVDASLLAGDTDQGLIDLRLRDGGASRLLLTQSSLAGGAGVGLKITGPDDATADPDRLAATVSLTDTTLLSVDGTAIELVDWPTTGIGTTARPDRFTLAIDGESRLAGADVLLAGGGQPATAIDSLFARTGVLLRADQTARVDSLDFDRLGQSMTVRAMAVTLGAELDALARPMRFWNSLPPVPRFEKTSEARFDAGGRESLADFLQSNACPNGCSVTISADGPVPLESCRLESKQVRLIPEQAPLRLAAAPGARVTLANSSLHLVDAELTGAGRSLLVPVGDEARLVLGRCRVTLPNLAERRGLKLHAIDSALTLSEGLPHRSVRLHNCLVEGGDGPLLTGDAVVTESTLRLSGPLVGVAPGTQPQVVWLENSVVAAATGSEPSTLVAADSAAASKRLDWMSDRLAIGGGLGLARIGTAELPLADDAVADLLPAARRTLADAVLLADDGSVTAGSLAATAGELGDALGADLTHIGPRTESDGDMDSDRPARARLTGGRGSSFGSRPRSMGPAGPSSRPVGPAPVGPRATGSATSRPGIGRGSQPASGGGLGNRPAGGVPNSASPPNAPPSEPSRPRPGPSSSGKNF